MKIYTRTGDQGETSYIGGRISKASDMIDLVGELDEINSNLGLAISKLKAKNTKNLTKLSEKLHSLQSQIFNLGALVARPGLEAEESEAETRKILAWVEDLEQLIDEWDEQLEPLQNFILPGGGLPGAQLHQTRAVVRRAERTSVRLIKQLEAQPESNPNQTYSSNLETVQKYLNRLSDCLFTAARFVNQELQQAEIKWSGTGEQMQLNLK